MARCRPVVHAACALVLLCGSGCQSERIFWSYGHRHSGDAFEPSGASVNGTTVFGDLFEEAGHAVHSWHVLSPRLARADTIVWVPNRFQAPTTEECDWFDNWLSGGGKTLIYVGRDFDAEPGYWNKVMPSYGSNPPPEALEAQSLANLRIQFRHNDLDEAESCAWFAVDRKPATRPAAKLAGPWAADVREPATEMQLGERYKIPKPIAALLEADGESIVTTTTGTIGGTIVVVTNGSFLLNLPLVNKEHRVLAGKLVDFVGPPGQVVFLETGPEPARILGKDPEPQTATGMELFFVWPLNYILLHLALLGVAYMFYRLPIFGVPRRVAEDRLADFGRHVAALGRHLARTNERAYALARLRNWFQPGRSEPVETPKPPPEADPLGETIAERQRNRNR